MDHLDAYINVDEAFEEINDSEFEKNLKEEIRKFMEQNPQAAPQQPKMMILTKDTGKKVLLFLNQIDSISESNYGMTVTTKAGKTYDVTESFNTLIRQLKGA